MNFPTLQNMHIPSPPSSPDLDITTALTFPPPSTLRPLCNAERESIRLLTSISKKKVRRRSSNVNTAWLLSYGLQCTARDTESGEIVTVSCRFCYAFGREKQDSRNKRNAPISVAKHWTKGRGGFRTDNFTTHFKSQHAERWKEYEKLTRSEKEKYFDVQVPFSQTLRAHFGSIGQDFNINIRQSIVVDVLQEMLLENEMFRLNSIFKQDVESMSYNLKINNRQNFETVIGQVMLGGSFRHTQRSISRLKSQGTLTYIGSISENEIGKYVQCVTAISLQYISNCLLHDYVWGYSVAFDAGNNHGDAYIDVRIRFYDGEKLQNVHALAIPLRSRHTGENMAMCVARLLEALIGNGWTDKLVGLSSDGAASMVGRISGAVTRLEKMVPHPVYRVWCGAHQLDLAVQDAFVSSLKISFQGPLHSLISYLRRQTNLKQSMGSVCPTVSTTRWLSIGEVCKWLLKNRLRVQQYLSDKSFGSTIGSYWWVLVYSVNHIMSEVNECFKYVQGLDTLLQDQNRRLHCLLEFLINSTGVEVMKTSMDVLAAASDDDVIVQSTNIAARRTKIVNFIEQLGSYPTRMFDAMDTDVQDQLISEFSNFIIKLYINVGNLVVMRDSTNAPSTNQAPPVLPTDLVSLTPREFYSFIENRKELLLHSVDAQKIEQIEEQFLRLRRIELPESCKSKEFGQAWRPLGQSFDLLRRFCGALSTVFPTTASVESDFSLINYECDDHSRSLTQLSLAGILHSKQWDEVKRIRVV